VFLPPRCPNRACRSHREPAPCFFIRDGVYHARCRSHPVPRFRCRLCVRCFSRQTFRADRRQKKPHINAICLDLMVACVGLRQAARILRVARRTVERRTLFIVATAVGPLRRKGRMTRHQRRQRTAHEALHGRRPSRSPMAVRKVLSSLRPIVPRTATVVLESDEKPIYGQVGRVLFGRRFRWNTHSASTRRDRANPLFPINHTNARLRHFLARLRRRTWCVSKRREKLHDHLKIAALWSNFCRGITRRTRTTPAQALGMARRGYRLEEILAWREDWESRSPALQN